MKVFHVIDIAEVLGDKRGVIVERARYQVQGRKRIFIQAIHILLSVEAGGREHWIRIAAFQHHGEKNVFKRFGLELHYGAKKQKVAA